MTRSKSTPRETGPTSTLLVINFGDDSTQWFKELSAAVSELPQQIEIQFVGGSVAPPYEIIALRNALLRIPRSIRLVTTALASLPPFTCAAWLAGDERRIAKDSVVWVPDLPEDILRNGARRAPSVTGDASARSAHENGGDLGVDDEDSDSEEEGEDPVPFGRPRSRLGRRRCERDLRALSDVLNEWFPCWEFRGSFLTCEDLLAWDVVRPEWCFGGRGVRNRSETPVKAGRKSGGAKKSPMFEVRKASGNTAPEVQLKCGDVEGDAQQPRTESQGGQATAHEASKRSDPASEPEASQKPSDISKPE